MNEDKNQELTVAQIDEKENKRLSVIISKILPFTRFFFERFPWLAQFVDFSMVGVINAFLSYGLYALCIRIGLHHQIANQISYWISVINGYMLNKNWVFANQSNKRSHTETVRYFMLYGFNFFLGIFLLWLYVDYLHLNSYIAPFLSMPVTIPFNYCANRFWVFKNKDRLSKK